MRQNESITNLMTDHVFTVNPKDPFTTVKGLMEEKKVHHVPVVEDGKLVGIVSRTDVLSYAHSKAFGGGDDYADKSLDETVAAKDLMTENPISIKSNDTIKHAVEMLNEHTFNSVPVVDDKGEKRLVGMVTTKDLLSYLVKQY